MSGNIEIKLGDVVSTIPVYAMAHMDGRPTPWLQLHEKATAYDMGFIPLWLWADNPEPARVQLDRHYPYGGGFRPFTGFKLFDTLSIQYPGDPLYQPLWLYQFRPTEWIIIYPHAWVMILDPTTRGFEIARMD